jgi:twitching motility protein PilT
VIPAEPPSFEQLGLPPALKQLSLLRNGLVLVTGPTGSGKSTTLAAMLDYYNRHRAGHVITIEDPVEFVHRPKRSLVNQRELGTHTHGFPNALRAARREDPDVLLVGEMRDLETISLAITAAETGHLVFATLHTNGAAKSVDRIVNAFPEGEQKHVQAMLAGALAGIVSQALLPRAGRRGRVAALEILVATPAVSALIREGKAHQITNLLQTGRRFGMQSMEQALTALVVNGEIERDTAEQFLASTGGHATEDASATASPTTQGLSSPVFGGIPGRGPYERAPAARRPEYRPQPASSLPRRSL